MASIVQEVDQIHQMLENDREESARMKSTDTTEELHKEAKIAIAVTDHKTGNSIGGGLVGRLFQVATELAIIVRTRSLKAQPIDKASSFLQ